MNNFLNQFPYSDFHEMNLDWIIRRVKELAIEMQEFTVVNKIAYADPIEWNITTQYPAFNIVYDEASARLMISKQPVPKGVSINNAAYWALVSPFKIDDEFSTTSINPVTNRAVTAKFNDVDSDIADLEAEDIAINGRIDTTNDRIDATNGNLAQEITDRTDADTALSNRINAADTNIANEAIARTNADIAINTRIDNLATLSEGSTTGDAELIDSRTGDTGIVYSSAGDAIRDQYSTNRNLIEGIYDAAVDKKESTVFSGYSASNTTAGNAKYPYVLNNNAILYQNCIVTKIKLNVSTAGPINIGLIKDSDVTSYDVTKLEIIDTLTLPTGLQNITLPTPIYVPYGYCLFMGIPADTIVWYVGSSGTNKGMSYNDSGTYVYTTGSTGVDITAIPLYDIKAKDDNNENLIIEMASKFTGNNEATIAAGVSGSNSSTSTNNGPYVLIQSTDVYKNALITKIKMDVATAGTVVIGYCPSDVIEDLYDVSDFTITNVLRTSTTGVQTFTLDNPFLIPSGCSFFISIPGANNSMKWKYGTGGATKGFYYVNTSTLVYTSSNSSIGIDIIGINIEKFESTYKGKTLSILGDSISTFSGYIPEGNVTYYPSGTVQYVSDTWWYKFMTALGMTLNTNNSWSGSKVSGSAASAGCGDRATSLGTTPDVIIIWMGINDFNNEVPLGTYDGKSAIPEDVTKFREAYGIMLNKVLTAYPTAEVWCCTLPQCERNDPSSVFPEINGNGVALATFNEAIIELSNAFGVKLLDHNKAGLTYQNMSVYNPDELHPNKYGHSLIANFDIREFDGLVRTRYPISD
ncbi:MAG: hypothetical protein IKU36_00885 [Bacteroidales bacterium]|nr:hypothetical protein [Bacteroidales bacterium]